MNGFASVVRIFHSRGAEEKGSNGLRERIKHSKSQSWSTSVIGILRQPFADIASWVRLGLRARRKTARSDGSPSPDYSDWYAMNKRTIRIEVGPPGVLL